MTNEKLNTTKENKADEFYTQYETIENEVNYYSLEYFKNKIVLYHY